MQVELRVRLYRPSALSDSPEFVNTLMVEPVITGEIAETAGSASVALVIDASGSMAGEGKLDNAKKAAEHIVDRLRDGDRLAVIAFDHEANVVVPLQGRTASEQIRAGIAHLTPGGGTEMGKAMDAASRELSKVDGLGARRVIVLTDGETADDAKCRSIAERARDQRLPISTYGLGSEWNAELLQFIAETTLGHVGRIGGIAEIAQQLAGEFKDLQNTALVEGALVIAATDGVTVRSAHRVIPEVTEYALAGAPEYVASVGDISRDPATAAKYLVDVVLPPRAPGPVRVARVWLRYREPDSPNVAQTEPVNAVVTYTVDRGQAAMIDPQVKTLIDQREASRMVVKAQEALDRGEVARATTLLSNARKVTQNLGNARVTTQLDQALEALMQSGSLSEEARKTIHFGTKQTTQLTE